MYIIERRKASDLKLYESIEVVKSAYVENEHFINAIKKEISTFMYYGFNTPNLKNSEILKINLEDGISYKWIIWDFQDDYEPFVFLASTTQPDTFTDLILDIEKWKKEIAEEGYKPVEPHETKNSDYIIA